jgi:ParB/RepB/Spo0J family partition protein
MKGMLKLTGLADAVRAQGAAAGRPPMMRLTDILPDPDNPREPFEKRTPEEQQEQMKLNEDVGSRGVKSPISLRPHPAIPGKWIINHGHCRYEAAEFNQQPEIPYFIDPDFNSYDQVNENELRSPLSPWALATFIDKRLKAGDSKGEIAARLHKNQNVVTEYLALVDAPTCLHAAYAAGVKSPRTLYDLRRAWDEFPDNIDVWCATRPRITRDTIKDLLQQLRRDVIEAPVSESEAPVIRVDAHEDALRVVNSHEQTVPANDPLVIGLAETPLPVAPTSAPDTAPTKDPETPKLRHDVATPALRAKDVPESGHKENIPAAARGSAGGSAPRAKKERGPQIMVEYDGKNWMVAPTSTVRIQLEGTTAVLDVQVKDLVILAIH